MNKNIRIKSLIFSTSFILSLSLVGCNLIKKKQSPKTNSYTVEENNTISEEIANDIENIIITSTSPTPTTSPSVIESEKELEEINVIEEDNRTLVALTFDDGPCKYTDDLALVLKQYNVSATFFVLGCNCDNYPTSLINLYEDGHEIAIHGKSHTAFTKLSINEINNEIADTINYIEELGIDVTELVRPPYGSLNSEIRENVEYPFILWNIDTEDWKTKNKEKIKEEILSNLQEASIILMHDTNAVHSVNVEVLKELLPELTKEYKFVTISELFNSYNVELENGKAYRKIIKNED